jgi:hypothetical protein
MADGRHGILRQPFAGLLLGLLAGVDLEPGDGFAPGVLGHGGVEHPAGSGPDIGTDAVALDEGNDGAIRDGQLVVLPGDLLAVGGGAQFVEGGGHVFSPYSDAGQSLN